MKNQENISEIEQFVIDLIRKIRDTKNLSQYDLASILGVGKTFISNVESRNNRAKYNLNHINAFADHWNISPGELLPQKPFPAETRTEKKKTPAKRKEKKINRVKRKPSPSKNR